MPASLKSQLEVTLYSNSTEPLIVDEGLGRNVARRAAAAPYCAFGCLSGSALRTCAFTAVSSTAVVPVTSEAKLAPAGTR